jgi:hypothetical protein
MKTNKFEFWLMAWLVLPLSALAEVDMDASQYPLVQSNAQVGVDLWRMSPELPARVLLMPNNSVWHYRPESPWGTFEGHLMVSSKLTFKLNMRADQSMGTHVDELSGDWAQSPSLGFRAGVLSYKTSWCQTYNVDSPWVRENDPFCTSKSTSEASGGAPGLQIYANTALDDYRVQMMAGIYRPLLFNYNTQEFSNLGYATSHVDVNDKSGASVSVLHAPSVTELRVGLLSAKQSARALMDSSYGIGVSNQTYGIAFFGLSFYVMPRLNVRLQTLRHALTAAHWAPPKVEGPRYQGGNEFVRRSDVMELNYRYSGHDVLAFAVSRYNFDNMSIITNYPDAGYTRFAEFPYLLSSASTSWRHDWQKGIYTSIQWTYNRGRAAEFQNLDQSSMTYRGAHGVGLRLAYQF